MTHESEEVMAVIDAFPLETRRELRDAFLRIAEVYRSNGARELPPAPDETLPPNVIQLRARREST